ncbi:MAG TPA: hypothetical protein VII40_09075 [Xanthobacteraceae bacterium]
MMTSIRASLVAAPLAVALVMPLHAQGQSAAPAPPPVAAALSTAERAELLRQAQAGLALIDDIDALIQIMPPEFFKLVERSQFEQRARAEMAQMKALDARIVKAEFGEPTTPYRAGRDIICFLPNTLLMQIKGRLYKSRGYLLAARSIDGGAWKFLDGAAIDEHHEWLWIMFPELPRDIRFPEQQQKAEPVSP